MTWQVRSSNKMLILGIVFFISGFVSMTIFFEFIPFLPYDRLTIWMWAVVIASFFALGLFSIIVVKIRDAIVTLIAFFVWSLILFVPVPQGYEEVYYGGSLSVLAAMMILYVKYKEHKKT